MPRYRSPYPAGHGQEQYNVHPQSPRTIRPGDTVRVSPETSPFGYGQGLGRVVATEGDDIFIQWAWPARLPSPMDRGSLVIVSPAS